MDHKTFVTSLPAPDRAALHHKSNTPGLIRAALHFGLIVGMGLYIALGGPLWQLLVLPQGILIVFTFTLLHETVHDTPFATPWLNRLAGWIAALFLVLPPVWFKYFHLAHHRYTNDPDKDPELADPKPQHLRAYLWHLSGLPVWASHLHTLMRNALGRATAPYLPARALGRVRSEARAMVVFYLLCTLGLVSGHTWLFWSWVLPALLGQPFLRLYLMAEHGRCPPVADMFENTRTTYTARVVRWVAWNMPYHCEHHAMPNVPFHQLPRLNQLTAAHLKSVSDGYGAFHRDYMRALD